MTRYLLAASVLIVATPLAAQGAKPADYYVKAAGAGDLYERQSSQLVLETTKNPKVRQFATMMLSDHASSTKMVTDAAMREKLKPMPRKLMPAQEKMIAQLRAANGTARDTAYLAQQKQAHQTALELHRSYAQSGSSMPLKSAAAKIVPVVQHHIDMLKTM